MQDVLRDYALRYWHPNEPEGTVELAVVSNQAGVSLRYLSDEMAAQLLWQTLAEALDVPGETLAAIVDDGWRISAFDTDRVGLSIHWCASHLDLLDMRRKPNPAMLWEAMTEHQVLPERSLMVRDRPEDELAAQRANVPFLSAAEFFNWGDCDA